MAEYIMAGCDHHDKTNLLMTAADRGEPEKRSFPNTEAGVKKMIAYLEERKEEAGAKVILFAYEASSLGFALYDQITADGVVGYVLAPTKMKRSQKRRKNKTDVKDAKDQLNALRAHVLAGDDLPEVWVPDPQTRADRSLVRLRLKVAENVGGLKTQINSLLKLHGLKKPTAIKVNWTVAHFAWLQELLEDGDSPLAFSERAVLDSLLRQVRAGEEELDRLQGRIVALSEQPRYAEPVKELCSQVGVGVLTAMVFLVEMGDLSRFHNRRQVGSFLGLAPATFESGERDDRKGHITHQGPARVRKVLNQAVWVRRRHEPKTRAFFDDLEQRDPKRKKIHAVAHMRKLGILLWHRGLEAQQRAGCFPAASET